MKYFTKILVILVIMISCSCPSGAFAQEYKLGVGDVIHIGIWGYDDLPAAEIAVRPDGRIAFPFVGEIEVVGKSPTEVTEKLTTDLSRYLVNPHITINVTHFRTTRVYVLGEVQRPGLYELDQGHALIDAISMAGGYTKDAAKKTVQIIRRDKSGQLVTANILNLLKKGDLSQNYVLNQGDIVYLSSNGRIDLARDIAPWVALGFQIHDWNRN